jgi:two-component system, cell cycle sensor histidine kinase and response regulator CckA
MTRTQPTSNPVRPVLNHTVLIIDDSPLNLSVIMEQLRREGLEVLVATSGEVGIERAVYVRPDIILLDVLLPGIDGYETCRRLQANQATSKTPVIFMTVLNETNDLVRGFSAGAVDYVNKPLKVDEVLARITTHLRLSDLSRSLEQQNMRLAELSGTLSEQKEQLHKALTEAQHARQELEKARDELEIRVAERTQALSEANAALSSSEEHYRVILSSISDAVLIADKRDRPVFVSPNAGHVLGYDASALVAIGSMNRLFGGELVSQAELDSLGQVENLEREIIDSQGSSRILLVTVKRVAINTGTTLYTCRDITRRKELEAQLRQAQKMEAIGRLAGGVAHDFNNLLTVIIGHSTLLLEHPSAHDEASLLDIQQIRVAGERAASLTRQLLAFSRQQVLEMQVLNLNTVLNETLQMLIRLIGEDIELVTHLAPDLSHVRADVHQMQQILLNLAVNARDAMPDGGTLTIETANVQIDTGYMRHYSAIAPGSYVALAVSDTGVGMDNRTRERIFEPFFTTKEPGRGTGLGLATVHGIVNQSGGHVYVYSELHYGTTFKIYLPCVVDEQTELLSPAEPLSLDGSETILLVEDEQAVRNLVREVLSSHGYHVLEATAEGALDLARVYTGSIDLLLTDVVMPVMSGRELVEKMHVLKPDTRVLYMSGYTEHIIASRGMLPNTAAFLQKPFTPDILARKVRMVLDAGASML